MNILHIKKLEECLDRTMIYEYSFGDSVSELQIRTLGRGGDLSYFPEFSRPFFKLVTADGLQIKGIVGDQSLQVVFPIEGGEARVEAFSRLLAGIGSEGRDEKGS